MADKGTTKIVLILGAAVVAVAVLVEYMGRITAASNAASSGPTTAAATDTTTAAATDTASTTTDASATTTATPSNVVVNVAAPVEATPSQPNASGLTFPPFPGFGFGLFSPAASTSTSAASAGGSAT